MSAKGYERYKLGITLEANGLTCTQVAKEIGLKNATAWSNLKFRCKPVAMAEKAAALTQRAADAKPDKPEPAVILEDVACEKVPITSSKPAVKEAPAKVTVAEPMVITMLTDKPKAEKAPQMIAQTPVCLSITKELSAKGLYFTYRLAGRVLSIRRQGLHAAALTMTMDEMHSLLDELNELLREAAV